MKHSLTTEYIRRYVLAKSTGKPIPTLEDFCREFPGARTQAFVDWFCEFTARQARRERNAA